MGLHKKTKTMDETLEEMHIEFINSEEYGVLLQRFRDEEEERYSTK